MFRIEIIRRKISREELQKLAIATFGDMVKVAVDIERGIMAAGGEMHADCEQALLADGSKQDDLWGANIYPDAVGEGFIEYQSLINIRPKIGNRGMEIEDENIRVRVAQVINSLIS